MDMNETMRHMTHFEASRILSRLRRKLETKGVEEDILQALDIAICELLGGGVR